MTTKRLDNMTVRYGIRRHVIFHLKDFIFHHLRFFLVKTNTFVNFIAWGSWCSILEDMRIWSIQISICLSDCNGIRTHYHLVFKLTLKHLAKLAWTFSQTAWSAELVMPYLDWKKTINYVCVWNKFSWIKHWQMLFFDKLMHSSSQSSFKYCTQKWNPF